ncbi:hypothetical protein [Vibrio mimicus]|uniref:hypothetical protein n=1 Tax=Vibrio mimicus TaxID=674 RepID=UPI0001B64EE2|nr:hypothetical protein [Vibrio mimicus]EEW09870.1 indirect negative regulator of sigma-B activity [Vibrio mimicus VM573]
MNFDIAVRQVPYFGEPEAGDGYMVYQNEDDLLVVIIDALGHGPNAADLARAMERFLNEKANFDLTWLMQSLHEHFMGKSWCGGHHAASRLPKKPIQWCGDWQ